MIRLKRIYEKPEKSDGLRILVDRLWPRGISKQKAALDLWLKDIAPSDNLRKWYGHDPEKWTTFQKKYRAEITTNKETFNQLKEIVKDKRNIILLYATKDNEHNQAVVIKNLLQSLN